MIPDFERVTAPDYIDSFGDLSMGRIREMRAECQELENAASYVRRFAQARLDMIVGGDGGPDLAAKLAAGPDRQPDSDQPGTENFARPPQELEPNSFAEQLVAELDKVVAPSALRETTALSADERSHMVSALSEFEQTISRHRAELHGIIDTLQAEVVRRYRDGEESLDSLLA